MFEIYMLYKYLLEKLYIFIGKSIKRTKFIRHWVLIIFAFY